MAITPENNMNCFKIKIKLKYIKIYKNTGTSRKFDTSQKTVEAFSWNFLKLHPRRYCKTLAEFQILVTVFNLVINDLNWAF